MRPGNGGMMADVEVQIRLDLEGCPDEAWIVRLVGLVCEAEGVSEGSGVTVVLTDDQEIHALNRTYRQVDLPTDVLAFGEADDGFARPPGLAPYLGDIIISFPTAIRQAEEQGHSVEEELALLIVHGCLHLLGYDHADEDEQRLMWARQDEILSRWRQMGQARNGS